MLNASREIISLENVFVQVGISETMNPRTGDTDMQLSCTFHNRNCADIGKAFVRLYNDKEAVRGDYHGRRLWDSHRNEILEQFQLLA